MSATPDNDCDGCPNCGADTSGGLCADCYDAACVDRAEDLRPDPDNDCDDPEVTAIRRLLLWSWP